MKITCDVIRDLAELYAGDALSNDSKLIVEEHIAGCQKCREYIAMSKTAFENVVPVDCKKVAEEKANIESLRDKILGKVLPIVMMTIVIFSVVFAAADYMLFEREIVIPYDGETVYATEEGILHYPNCYDVAIIESGSSEYVRVQVETNYIDKIRGVKANGEQVLDLKDLVKDGRNTYVVYADGVNQQVVWEKK